MSDSEHDITPDLSSDSEYENEINALDILRDELAARQKENSRMFMAYIWMTLWVYMWISIVLLNKQ